MLILARQDTDSTIDAAERLAQQAWDATIRYGAKVVGVAIFLFVVWLLAGRVRRLVRTGLERAKFEVTLSRFFGNLARWTLLALAVLACLSVFGIQTTSFAALIGAVGLAIALAFQGSLSNLSAGVMLLVFRPFKVGDTITVGGQTGTVGEIDLFLTELDTVDGRRIFMPNNQIFGATIENLTYHPRRRAEVIVKLSAAHPPERVRSALEAAARQSPGALVDPAPAVVLADVDGGNLVWAIYVWAPTPDLGAVRQALIQEIRKSIESQNFGAVIPTSQVISVQRSA